MPSTGSLTASWKNSGTIWVRPPMLTARIMNRVNSPTFFSSFSCDFIYLGSSGDLRGSVVLGGLGSLHGAPGVVGHHQHAGEEDRATDHPHHETGVAGFQCFDEGVGQRAVVVDRAPHQALGVTALGRASCRDKA